MVNLKKIFPIKSAAEIFNNKFLVLFLVSLFLIEIPPLYPFFPIRNNILMSYGIVGIITATLFFFILIKVLKGDKTFVVKNQNTKLLLIFFLIYFAFQTLSIVNAFSLGDFIHDYKSIFIAGLFLFITVFVKENVSNFHSKIILILFAAGIFNFFYQLLIFFTPDLFKTLGGIFVYSSHLNLVLANMQRGRIFIETYDEILIPFIFIFFLKMKKDNRNVLFIFLLLMMIILPTFLSEFRTRILMLVFSFIASIALLQRTKFFRLFTFMFIFAVIYLAYFILNSTYGHSFIDRLNFQSQTQDVETISFRINNIFYSYDLGIKNPVTGVGLGNYYANLPVQKISLSDSNNPGAELAIASQNPHNIFAQLLSETGFLSLFFYVFMLCYFLISDLKNIRLRKLNEYSKAFIISFWTLFIYSLFNPVVGLTYNMLFWMLRALI